MDKHNNRFPTNTYNDRYSSLIRTIKIFLPSRAKEATDDSTEYDDFVGRERLMERLFNWLSDKSSESGSYLVTGFRGMGKTKLVERVINRLTREVKGKQEPWWWLVVTLPAIVLIVAFACFPLYMNDKEPVYKYWWIVALFLVVWIVSAIIAYYLNRNYFSREKKRTKRKYPNHELFDDEHVDRIARGKRDDKDNRQYNNIKISVNLGHEVLRERDVLSMITTSFRDKYKPFVKSSAPHVPSKIPLSILQTLLTISLSLNIYANIKIQFNPQIKIDNTTIAIQQNVADSRQLISSNNSMNATNQQFIVNGGDSGSWFSRFIHSTSVAVESAMVSPHLVGYILRILLFVLLYIFFGWLLSRLLRLIPYYSVPLRAIRRLDILTERLNTITGEETGMAPSAQTSVFTISLFNRKRQKTRPIADIREIETELADIINLINSDKCPKEYRARFIVVFDEMDKIDPAMIEKTGGSDIPEYTDAVNGFPSGLESRERRHNVLKLLANIKLFVSTARAKFVFISGRELYDAYLADLSDRDFAISSMFTGVINVDSFLTPEGGQTDVRSMSEWYITNRLLPEWYLRQTEYRNARGNLKGTSSENESRAVLKKEMPSLRWYYEYLVDECKTPVKDATHVVGFLHVFAAYLTHISNGSPKKIFLYFEKYIRRDKDCLPMNDWGDVLCAGRPDRGKESYVMYFEPIQQKTINFVYYLADPIMGTITNDLSNYGDRFLVSLSFVIDHIYKHHNRSFSWRNLEQIPELLKTNKAPELRDSMMSIMEYLTQTHISPILIGLNEYKFHRSIAEEISVMSKMSDEASAIFNFTLDESLPVILHNTRLLNHYMELDKPDRAAGGHRQYLPIIARIHSNLGDLHFWDEDYYAASLEYRASIDAFSKDETVWGFLTRIRCILKLGLTYESRKLFPNAYQLYGQLMELLIKKRWIDEEKYRLTVREQYVDDWRGSRQVMVEKEPVVGLEYHTPTFEKQFLHDIVDLDEKKTEVYSANVDGLVSSFARDLTEEKTATINSLTLFEEVRYVYQAVLAKLSVLEKMGMSGITQTNIDVAEGEFKAIHKSVNVREKFIISADFFRKLAEILYYKNSLTILTQNQDSLYASIYYDDYDLLANLDDFCRYDKREVGKNMQDGEWKKNAVAIRHDVKFFFNNLDNPASQNSSHPVFEYDFNGPSCSYAELFKRIQKNLGEDLRVMQENGLFRPEDEYSRIYKNVYEYLEYNIKTVKANKSRRLFFRSVEDCDHHCLLMRKRGLRPPCYACKYYTRSLRILADNMFDDKNILENKLTKAYGILKHSFKRELLYTRSNHIRILAQTLEGFGNVMLSCASGNDLELEGSRPESGINAKIIRLLIALFNQSNEGEELNVIGRYEKMLEGSHLSRLDKSILYYYDAYRFYLMDSCYNEAANCLNKITNLLVYYIEVVCYYDDVEKLGWNRMKTAETVEAIVGDKGFHGSLLAILFRFVARHTSYKYDLTNLSEISELKWMYSKEISDKIDLTRLSIYPAIRATWLRIVEIRAKGMHYLEKTNPEYEHEDYLDFIKTAYPLIAPKDRYRTTFYEEVLGYYTKMRFNDHIMNDILEGNPMLDKHEGKYADDYHVRFYEKLADYLESDARKDRLECHMFETGGDVDKRLNLMEYLIIDTLFCITNMVKIFVPHNNLSSYSNSFIGIIYNFYWEWSHKYEFVYSLYQYHELMQNNRKENARQIVEAMASGGSVSKQKKVNKDEVVVDLRKAMDRCSKMLSRIEKDDTHEKYGSRSERFYGQLRHLVDDITINNIISNYTAEMALKYYQMAEETSTEGSAYKEMMGTMYFLDDDMNNDTNQFNIACDRFLLNCGVVRKQRSRLENLYKYSNAYHLRKSYIEGPNKLRDEDVKPNQFDRSQFINSEY